MNNIANTTNLKDIKSINIDISLPLEERKREFVKQIGNPYHFMCGNTEVTVSYSGETKLEERLIDCLIKK